MLVFSRNGIVQHSGHVTELSINFYKDTLNLSDKVSCNIFLYIIAQTNIENEFMIIHQYELPTLSGPEILGNIKIDTQDDNEESTIFTIKLHEPTLYLTKDQILGVGLSSGSPKPFFVKGNGSYYIDLKTADHIRRTGVAHHFVRQRKFCPTFTFTITSAPSLLLTV